MLNFDSIECKLIAIDKTIKEIETNQTDIKNRLNEFEFESKELKARMQEIFAKWNV